MADQPEVLGYALAYQKADYYRVFAGYMGELYSTPEEAVLDASEMDHRFDLVVEVRALPTNPKERHEQ